MCYCTKLLIRGFWDSNSGLQPCKAITWAILAVLYLSFQRHYLLCCRGLNYFLNFTFGMIIINVQCVVNISTLFLATMTSYFIIPNYVFTGIFLEISLYKIKQIKIVLNVPSRCDQHVSFIWLIALAINSSTMLKRDVRSWCTFLDLGPSLKGKVFTWASSSQTKIWAWTEKAGTKYHPQAEEPFTMASP